MPVIALIISIASLFLSGSAFSKWLWTSFHGKRLLKWMSQDTFSEKDVARISFWYANYRHNGGNGKVQVMYKKWAEVNGLPADFS